MFSSHATIDTKQDNCLSVALFTCFFLGGFRSQGQSQYGTYKKKCKQGLKMSSEPSFCLLLVRCCRKNGNLDTPELA